MVQCSRCDSWVHSHCEKMSGNIDHTPLIISQTTPILDEEYEILSDLPESVEYICRLCCPKESTNLPGWKIAVGQFKTEAFDKVRRERERESHIHYSCYHYFIIRL